MTRQFDVLVEERETKRRAMLVKALEFGIVGALESQGVELLGFSFKYDAFNCLMTIKAEIAGDKKVAFIGSDSIINCVLKCYSEAADEGLHWRADKYH